MWILLSILGIFVWTVAGVILFFNSDKHGPSPWWHWVVGAPIMVIAYIFSIVNWFKMRFGKTVPPVVVIDDGVYTGKYEKYRQIRVRSEQNIDWTINVYSDSPQKVKMYNNRGEKYES